MPEVTAAEELKKALDGILPETKAVEEVCFGEHHGLRLCHAGLGQEEEEKFVLLFKEKSV